MMQIDVPGDRKVEASFPGADAVVLILETTRKEALIERTNAVKDFPIDENTEKAQKICGCAAFVKCLRPLACEPVYAIETRLVSLRVVIDGNRLLISDGIGNR